MPSKIIIDIFENPSEQQISYSNGRFAMITDEGLKLELVNGKTEIIPKDRITRFYRTSEYKLYVGLNDGERGVNSHVSGRLNLGYYHTRLENKIADFIQNANNLLLPKT